MLKSPLSQPDPRLDLALERIVAVPAAWVWEAWTTPEHLKAWFWTSNLDASEGSRTRSPGPL